MNDLSENMGGSEGFLPQVLKGATMDANLSNPAFWSRFQFGITIAKPLPTAHDGIGVVPGLLEVASP
jgi:hypothetical protein